MRKHRGRKWRILGLLLIVAALGLTVYNIFQERSAHDVSMDTLGVLAERIETHSDQENAEQTAQPALIRGTADETAAKPEAALSEAEKETIRAQLDLIAEGGLEINEDTASQLPLKIVTPEGETMEWPMDGDGNPAPWPVDAQGEPLAELTDESGKTVKWIPLYSKLEWNTNASGELLPWFNIVEKEKALAWPLDESGNMIGRSELQIIFVESLFPEENAAATVEKLPMFVRNPGMEMPLEKIKGNYYIGILDIPVLELSLPIMSDWSYPKLRVAPCRYAGSVYSGDLVISGHNYSKHFRGLKQLQPGDELRFTDADGNVFFYTVIKLEQLGRYDVEKMKNGEGDLTLFTCTYGGGSRITVRCRLEGYEAV